MPARTTSFCAIAHLQLLASGCSSRAPVVCTRPTWPAPQQRPFHGTRSLRDEMDDKNHYETLNVKTNASAAEIKKSFYTLSKNHHPDHNPDDPNAPRRFMRISEAYTTLSHTASRHKYDRDVLHLHHHRGAPQPRNGSSYHSSGPAGGRPASGLSRRRGTFRGPPPSFFRSGGWGAHSAKRGAAHEESTGGGGGSSSSSSSTQSHSNSGEERPGGGSGTGGMGPGQEPPSSSFGYAGGEVPHFDRHAKEAHTRTQARVDAARVRARRDDGGGAVEEMSEVGRFFGVVLALTLALGMPYLGLRLWSNGSGREGKKKG